MSFTRWIAPGAAALAVLCATPAAQGQTLEEALALAYDSNPTLLAERAALRAVDEGFIQARSAALPSVSASVGTSVTDSRRAGGGDPTTGFTFPENTNTQGTTTTSVAINQNVYRGGRTRAAMDGALANIEAARARLFSVEQQVLVDAVTAYEDVRRDEEIVSIRANNVAVLERQLQAARDRFEVGEITRTDVAQAEARVAGARAQLSAARGDLLTSRATYERVIGSPPGTLAPPPPLPGLPSTLDEAIALGFDRNPDVVAARFVEEAAQADVRSAAGALRPSVSASLSARDNDAYLSGLDSESVTAGATLSIPLFAGGRNSSQLRQSRAAASQARLNLRNAERVVRQNVSSSWSIFESAQAVIVSSQEQVRANEIAFEGVEEEARVGLRTTLDVLDAEQELLESRLTLVSAERDVYVAGFRLLQASGGLSAQALGVDAEYYDPDVNLSDIRRRYVGIGILE